MHVLSTCGDAWALRRFREEGGPPGQDRHNQRSPVRNRVALPGQLVGVGSLSVLSGADYRGPGKSDRTFQLNTTRKKAPLTIVVKLGRKNKFTCLTFSN